MYNFTKQQATIIQSGKEYGVTLLVQDKKLVIPEDARISDSVKKWLTKKVDTYNKRVVQGF